MPDRIKLLAYRVAIAVAAFAAAMGLGACSNEPERPCLEGHSVTVLQPVYTYGKNGATLRGMYPMTTWVCEKWGKPVGTPKS